jgi:two-component system, cell cycle response regulator
LRDRALAWLLRERALGPFLAALVLCALAISWLVTGAMSLALHGSIRGDFLLTGAVASLTAAPPLLGGLLLVIKRLRALSAQLEHQAVTDPLTEVSNRRAFQSCLLSETRRAARYGRPLSLVVLDLDAFKVVNDSFGHATGDRVLIEAAKAIAEVLREPDLLFRVGGDEFAVVLPETDLEGAAEAGLRICQLPLTAGRPDGKKTTVSCGVAQFQPPAEPSTLFEIADQAMYRAKAAGGDRVERS